MHKAPSVSYPVGRCRAAGWLGAGLSLAGLFGSLYWGLTDAAPGGPLAATLVLWLFVSGLAARDWWRMPAATLRWDGAQWLWRDARGAESPCLSVQVRADLGGVVLLQCRGAAVPRWLWIESSAGQPWIELRRALYAAPAAALPPRAA